MKGAARLEATDEVKTLRQTAQLTANKIDRARKSNGASRNGRCCQPRTLGLFDGRKVLQTMVGDTAVIQAVDYFNFWTSPRFLRAWPSPSGPGRYTS